MYYDSRCDAVLHCLMFRSCLILILVFGCNCITYRFPCVVRLLSYAQCNYPNYTAPLIRLPALLIILHLRYLQTDQMSLPTVRLLDEYPSNERNKTAAIVIEIALHFLTYPLASRGGSSRVGRASDL